MNRFSLTVLTALIPCLQVLAQQGMLKQEILKKNYLPNVVPVMGEYLYISPTEVSNREYYEFLSWLHDNGQTEAYVKNLPDSSKWRAQLNYCEPFVNHYFRHPAYRGYPVVNITQRQAENYCNWVASRIMETEAFKRSPIEKIRVRLPSEQEWMLAARMGLPASSNYPWEEKGVRKASPKKHQGEFMGNFARGRGDNAGIDGALNDKGFITTPVKSYWPNPAGLYNLAGNVAEWIEEPARTKGGSWNLPPYNARIDQKGAYDGDSSARADVGFRYVIEVVSLKQPVKQKSYTLSAKLLEGQLMYTDDSVFASAVETPNWLYGLFLAENPDSLYRPQSKNWFRWFRYDWYTLYDFYPFYDEYPVVNISYEAARDFCNWLTRKYNASERRAYKKVVFYLPSPEEWEEAAKGDMETSDYPWGGPYTRNSKGCYLANFCPLEEQYLYKDSLGHYSFRYPGGDRTISRPVDGAITPAPVYSYFPNSFGLYNCAGNVAEMTSIKGISKGGSWDSDQARIRIDARETYSGPDATLGFRYFMRIIEK